MCKKGQRFNICPFCHSFLHFYSTKADCFQTFALFLYFLRFAKLPQIFFTVKNGPTYTQKTAQTSQHKQAKQECINNRNVVRYDYKKSNTDSQASDCGEHRI